MYEIQIGERVRFDGLKHWWLARATARDGRFTILTTKFDGDVVYSIVDHDQQIRGAMNVIGHGLGINTLDGPDEAIDAAAAMLDGADSTWGVSERNRLPLRITGRAVGSEGAA